MSIASHYLDKKPLGKYLRLSITLDREAVEYLDSIRGDRTRSAVIEQLILAEKARAADRHHARQRMAKETL